MNFIKKGIRKFNVERHFLLEQKWGLKKPADRASLSKSILKKYLPKNPVIVDCGAHVGSDAIELARIFPQAAIHCFEPVPSIYRALCNNVKRYKSIHTYNVALSSSTGKATMYVSSGASDASSSLQKPKEHLDDHPDVSFDETSEVITLTLDEWARQHSIPKIDFLWLDMQGHELEMLKASTVILPIVTAIYTEVSMKESYENTSVYPSFKEWMEQKGFRAEIEILPSGSDMGNVLFLKDAKH